MGSLPDLRFEPTAPIGAAVQAQIVNFMGKSGAWLQSCIKEFLTHLGLWERRKEMLGTRSQGIKQKLALAQALLYCPALISLT